MMPRSSRVWIFVLSSCFVAAALLAGSAVWARDVPFAAPSVVGELDRALWTAAADIDGDGDIDVLGTANDGDEVLWYENTLGDASTWVDHLIASPDDPQSLRPADIDGDGDIDVVAAIFGENTVVWWENTLGDGSNWTPHTILTGFTGANSTDVADFDGDGDPDVVATAITDGNLSWIENIDGDGNVWVEHSIDANLVEVRVAIAVDVDSDGDSDVVGAASGDNEVTWWENVDGEGSTWVAHAIGTSDMVSRLDGADIDGDGDIDVLAPSSNADELTWWENTSGDGTAWTEHTVATPNGPYGVDAVDLDGDGDVDLLCAVVFDDEVIWLENTSGDGSSWTEHVAGTSLSGATSVLAADLDGDGDRDVLASGDDADAIWWWENETIHRSATFPQTGAHTLDGAFDGARSVRTADVDGDGDIDVIGAAFEADDVLWWENTTGDGTTWTTHTIDADFDGAYWALPADVDGDGDIDVVGVGYRTTDIIGDDVVWWENTASDGSAWATHTIDADFDGANSVDIADIDGDGDLDIAGTAWFDHSVTWWENTAGDGSTWTTQTINSTYYFPHSVYAADIDGDGDLDLLIAGFGSDDVLWWENGTGDGTVWFSHTIDADFDGTYALEASDVDGDGDLDVLGAAYNGDELAWWENTGSDGSAWTIHLIATAFEQAMSIHGADLDGDGDLDVIGAAAAADDIAWWENTAGDGTTWTEHLIDGDLDGARAVYAADIDGDGDIDVLGAAELADSATWWENLGGQFALQTTDVSPSTIETGSMDAMLSVTAFHRGRSGDRDEELDTLELLLESVPGVALTSAEADALIDSISIYADDGDGLFESGADTLVTTVTSMLLSDGVLTVTVPDGASEVQIAHGSSPVFFIVAKAAASGSEVTPNTFVVTHLTDTFERGAVSTAEDRDNDIGLTLEWAADFSSQTVLILGADGVPCSDDLRCTSSFCVDGVCCENDCFLGDPVDCSACSVAAGAAFDGHCGPVAEDQLCGEGPTECSGQNTCDASGSCLPNDLPAGLDCGVTGPCDVQDTCDGFGTCTDNGFVTPGTICGEGPTDCADQGFCNASGLCQANYRPVGTPCGVTGPCDYPDFCDGMGGCTDNGHYAEGTACGDGPAECSAQDTCDSAGICLPNHLDGEDCDDGLDWTVGDKCTSGVCAGTELGACGEPLTVDDVPFTSDETTTGRPSHIDSYGDGCGSGAFESSDAVYELDASEGESFDVTLEPDASFDAVLAIVETCDDDQDCLAWSDEEGAGGTESLRFTAPSDGTFFVVVEGSGSSDGDFTLSVDLAASDGGADAGSDTGGGGGGCSCNYVAAGDPLAQTLSLLMIIFALMVTRLRRR